MLYFSLTNHFDHHFILIYTEDTTVRKKDRKFNRTTAGMAVTIPSDESCEQAHRRLVGVELGNMTRERRVAGKRCGSSGRGRVQEPTPAPVALVDGEVRYQ